MQQAKKVILIIMAILIGLFAITYLGLQWKKFFAPKFQNVEREVFEETKSYVHGKIQDLAKYHDEYNNATSEDKIVIQKIIKLQFAEFDERKITNFELKNFLIKMRGY